MKINWVTLRVNNLEVSKEFYGSYLGMDLEREFKLPGGMKFAFYKSESGMEIELIENSALTSAEPNAELTDPNEELTKPYSTDATNYAANPSKPLANPGISIGVAVDNYDDVLAEARTRGIITGEPALLGGQLECFFVEDPDGMSVQVTRDD